MTESVKEWALIIHADSADTRIDVYWVDIDAGRLGLRLANEIRQWRRRDGLLTIGNRIRIEVPPAPEPETPALPAVAPVDDRRRRAWHEYLAGRVRALVAHSEVAAKALQIEWPSGIPGLKHEGHTWEQLGAITRAVEFVEKNHSVPFYPEFIDPEQEESKLSHPSNVWARPTETQPTQADKDDIAAALLNHPRASLLREWVACAIRGGIDHRYDSTALAHALFEFARPTVDEWDDDALTTMLDGSLRALGYANGVNDLGRFNPEHAPLLMSAAFAIAAGTAYLLWDENEQPIVRTNVRKP